MRGWPALLALALAACGHRPPSEPPSPAPHYVVGAAYQLGGVWSYPQERFQYDATGLAERLPPGVGLTADGERADPTAMTGSHRTLQLPAIVDVTNLSNGRQIRIRLVDRGPVTPGRLLGLTPRAAELLDVPAGRAVPVRVELDSAASEALRDQLGGGPRGIVAAPVAEVTTEALAPPGQPQPRRVVPARGAQPAPGVGDAGLERLPETVRTVPVRPVQLWLRLATFSSRSYVHLLKFGPLLNGAPIRMRREGDGRRPSFVVTAGPFASVAAADAALDQARAAGVTDASIVVE